MSQIQHSQESKLMSDYTYWSRNLAGDPDAPKPRDGQPQCGFYKMRRGKDEAWRPVAIWQGDDGALLAATGPYFSELLDPVRIWLSCAHHPVPEDAARHAAEHGRWPGEPPPMPEVVLGTASPHQDDARMGIGGNLPPEDDGTETLLEQLLDQTRAAEDWLRNTEIKTKEDADTAANWADRLRDLNKKIEPLRRQRRKPLEDMLEKIQALFAPRQQAAKKAIDALTAAAQQWVRREQARLAEEARRKAEEEARRLREEQARKLAEQGLPLEAAPPPPPPKPVVAPKVMVGGASGRRMGTRKAPPTAHIVDIEKVLIFFKDHPDLVAAAQKLANKVVAMKGTVPGVEVVHPDSEAA